MHVELNIFKAKPYFKERNLKKEEVNTCNLQEDLVDYE